MNGTDDKKEPVTVQETAAGKETTVMKGDSNIFTQIFSGLGLGLLLGVIAGLSVSPVVQTILGTLITVISAFLSLQGGTQEAGGNLLSRLKINELRIGSFGFACVTGILLGLFIRSNDILSAPVKEQVEKWMAAGYSQEQARQYVALQKLGVKPEGKEIMAGEMQKAASSNLYAGLSDINLCYELNMERKGNDVREVLKAYRRQNNEKLTRLADTIERLPGEQQSAILKAIEEVLCELQKPKSSQ